jgi:hypothetical protein
MTRKAIVGISAVMALFTACGGDDDDGGSDDVSEDAQPYVDALIASAADQEPGDLQFAEGQVECVAPRWIEVFDPARLEEAGITPEELASSDDLPAELDLTEEDGAALYDAMVECEVDLRGEFVDSIASDSELSEEDRACLEEQFDDELLRRLFVVVLSQGEDALQSDEALMSEMFSVFSECPGAVPDS